METLSTKAEIVERLKLLAEQMDETSRSEIESLKQSFYRIINTEKEAARQAFVEAGGAVEDFQPQPDADEEALKQVMAVIRDKRSAIAERLEKEREMNYQVKLSIIEELKELVESADDPNKNYTEFKKLQQQWNEVTDLPAGKTKGLWEQYNHYVEQFYDLLKLNSEFRDYDFKKNLEIKTHLCEAAEKLATCDEVVSAFHQLQKLHEQFRETGPVARELREELWSRFKAASTLVNRRHQDYFLGIKETEEANLDQKTVICEIIEAYDYSELTTFNAWEERTKEVIALQERWKTIGFAPQKMNVKIFERFRKACDDFFTRKAEYFKSQKDEMNVNLEKKRQLCEKVEALKESTDWKNTAEKIMKLQKEWKSIGGVPRKHSDAVWKRFTAACDYFFEQRGKATHSQRNEEQENLQKKRDIIKRLQALAADDEGAKLLRDLQKEWNEVGHVPFKEKDRLFKQYRAEVDRLYDHVRQSASNRRIDGVKDRDKLQRTLDNMNSELKTYENNLGFLSASSKKGSSILEEMNRKVEQLKADIERVKQKIKEMN